MSSLFINFNLKLRVRYNSFNLLLDKQKDKPDPDVLLELASYYDLTLEAMMKKVLEVKVNLFTCIIIQIATGIYLTYSEVSTRIERYIRYSAQFCGLCCVLKKNFIIFINT